MATKRTSAIKKRKVDARNSKGLEQYEISGIGVAIETIICSRCKRIPDKAIYICIPDQPLMYQHLVCNVCNHLNNVCPMDMCEGAMVRNLSMEAILDKIGFKCPWAGYGCTEENIPRSRLNHRDDCEMNPNFVNCLYFFGNKCEFMFSTVYDDDAKKIEEMKEHLLFHNESLLQSELICGKSNDENFCVVEAKDGIYVTQVLNWMVNLELLEQQVFMDQNIGNLKGVFLAIWLIDTGLNQEKTISRYYVTLYEDYLVDYKIEMQLTIKSQPMSGNWNSRKCLPNLTWHTLVLNTREFKEFLMLSPQERALRNFSIPISHLRNYFSNASGEIALSFVQNLVKLSK